MSTKYTQEQVTAMVNTDEQGPEYREMLLSPTTTEEASSIKAMVKVAIVGLFTEEGFAEISKVDTYFDDFFMNEIMQAAAVGTKSQKEWADRATPVAKLYGYEPKASHHDIMLMLMGLASMKLVPDWMLPPEYRTTAPSVTTRDMASLH